MGEGFTKTHRVTADSRDSEGRVHAYEVRERDDVWSCDCMAFRYGGGKPCKHIRRAQGREKIKSLDRFTEE